MNLQNFSNILPCLHTVRSLLVVVIIYHIPRTISSLDSFRVVKGYKSRVKIQGSIQGGSEYRKRGIARMENFALFCYYTFLLILPQLKYKKIPQLNDQSEV